jgi:hypothetical protein
VAVLQLDRRAGKKMKSREKKMHLDKKKNNNKIFLIFILVPGERNRSPRTEKFCAADLHH